jgi:hypothetical protein
MFAMKSADSLPAFAVRHLCDAASVYDADFSRLTILGSLYSRRFHLFLYGARLGKVQLASESVIDSLFTF